MRGVDLASAISALIDSRPEPRARAAEGEAAPRGRLIAAIVVVALAYYVGAMVGMELRLSPIAPSFLWPPNAILTAVLLVSPPRRHWVLLLAALPAHLVVQALAGRSLGVALAFFVTN